MSESTEKLLSISQVADLIGCSDITIRRHIKSGRLPALMLDGRYRVRPRVLAEFLDAVAVVRPSPQ